jgi:Cof subfamily protein (haloacid dehalogenase superfamily)
MPPVRQYRPDKSSLSAGEALGCKYGLTIAISAQTRPRAVTAPSLEEISPSLAGIRLVATDLDGTLLDSSGLVSPRATKAIAAARAAGIHVLPATGRPPRSVWPIAATAPLGPIGVCSNGAAVVDLDTLTVTEVEPLSGSVSAEIVTVARALVPGILFALNDLETFRFEANFVEWNEAWDEEVCEVPDVMPYARRGCVKLLVRHPGSDSVALMERLQHPLRALCQVTTSGLDWVEIMAHGVSKASALARICARLGIASSEVVFIGDNYNDLTALAWAGYPMAPANAVTAALDVAARVLPANTDDGVAVLLEELVDRHR